VVLEVGSKEYSLLPPVLVILRLAGGYPVGARVSNVILDPPPYDTVKYHPVREYTCSSTPYIVRRFGRDCNVALPPATRLATGVVEATTKGAVPVATVEVIPPLAVNVLALNGCVLEPASIPPPLPSNFHKFIQPVFAALRIFGIRSLYPPRSDMGK
jgi:hypothetical protein